jgi:hypothetical protein
MPLLDSDVSVAKKMFDVNVFAVVTVTQAFAPLLIAAQGTIINIGSVLGKMPLPWQGYYNASKAAVAMLTDQMRIEFSPWKVRAILVTTGAIRTKFLDNLASAPRLPENSLYYPAKDVVEPSMTGAEIEKNAMDVNSYAEIVVNNAIRSSPKKHLWSGGGAWITWLASTFGWSTIWVGSFPVIPINSRGNKPYSALLTCRLRIHCSLLSPTCRILPTRSVQGRRPNRIARRQNNHTRFYHAYLNVRFVFVPSFVLFSYRPCLFLAFCSQCIHNYIIRRHWALPVSPRSLSVYLYFSSNY